MKAWRNYVLGLVTPLIPATRGFRLKRALWAWAGAAIGGSVRITSTARCCMSGSLKIGDGTWIGHDCLLVGGAAPVTIGENCDIGPRVTFATGTHIVCRLGPRVAGDGHSSPISIGSGSWIGAGVTILGGTHIGDKSLVAAGAVVKGTYPARSLIGGVPARVLGNLSGELSDQVARS